MAWIAPKTDWAPTDGVTDADLNRVEGNTVALQKRVYTFYDLSWAWNPLLTSGGGLAAAEMPINVVSDLVMVNTTIMVRNGSSLSLVGGNWYFADGEIYPSLKANWGAGSLIYNMDFGLGVNAGKNSFLRTVETGTELYANSSGSDVNVTVSLRLKTNGAANDSVRFADSAAFKFVVYDDAGV